MLSALILTEFRYPAMPLVRQLEHKRFVHPGPLVLRAGPFKFPPPTTDRDRTVSRRSEPSSRTALIGEQPSLFPKVGPPALVRTPALNDAISLVLATQDATLALGLTSAHSRAYARERYKPARNSHAAPTPPGD